VANFTYHAPSVQTSLHHPKSHSLHPNPSCALHLPNRPNVRHRPNRPNLRIHPLPFISKLLYTPFFVPIRHFNFPTSSHHPVSRTVIPQVRQQRRGPSPRRLGLPTSSPTRPHFSTSLYPSILLSLTPVPYRPNGFGPYLNHAFDYLPTMWKHWVRNRCNVLGDVAGNNIDVVIVLKHADVEAIPTLLTVSPPCIRTLLSSHDRFVVTSTRN